MYCESCRANNPDSAEFCYRCGAVFSAEAKEEARQRLLHPSCIRCGKDLVEGEDFCPHCGSPQDSRANQGMVNEVMRKTLIAKMLAFIPGIFNIFGLGHILLHSYLRGVLFMALSAAIYVCEFLLREWDMMSENWETGLLVFSLVVFMVQLWDVFKISYIMENRI